MSKSLMPAGWCGAAHPNETGGSPHHCGNTDDHPEFPIHLCPCGIAWSDVGEESAEPEPVQAQPEPQVQPCPAEHRTEGQCVLVARHLGRHHAPADDGRQVWWSA